MNGAIEMLQVTKLLKMAGGVKNKIISEAAEKVLKRVNAINAGPSVVKDMAIEGVQEMIQGALADGVAYFEYGKKYEGGWKEFVDHRIEEAVGAVGLAGGVAAGGKIMSAGGGKVDDLETVKQLKSVDAFGPDDLEKVFRGSFKLKVDETGDQAQVMGQLADALVSQSKHVKAGATREEAYAKMFVGEQAVDLDRDVLYQEPRAVAGFYSKLEQLIDSEDFLKSFGEKPAEAKALGAWLRKQGAKEEELEPTGMRGMLAAAEQAGVRIKKAELGEYLSKHAVKIDTVIKGSEKAQELKASEQSIKEQMQELGKISDKYVKKGELTPEETELY
jgi:hypothetical protein